MSGLSQTAVTADDIAVYKRDGVVCLRQVFDGKQIAELAPIGKDARDNRARHQLLPNLPLPRYMARTIPEFRRFVFDSTLGAVCGQILESETIRFFFDELFVKEPGGTRPTIWHSDRAGWPMRGVKVPSIWIPLTPVTKANSLECLAGSHRHDKLYWLFSPNARQMIRPEDRLLQPDIEPLRGDPDLSFLTWDMQPGDALVVHPWTLHYSSGNPTSDWRAALSIRVIGDDIRWEPRPDCLNIAGVCFDEMVAGEKPDGPLFPLLWSADGRRDGDKDYPRGFATRWTAAAYERLENAAHPKKGFNDYLAAQGGGTTISADALKADIRRTAS